jgi:exosortase/archaeosortase family protein
MPDDGGATAGRAGLRALLGLMAAGYGALVLAGVLAHDSRWAGALSLAAGLALLASGLPAVGAPRARLVALLGSACVAAPLGAALARGHAPGGPSLALLAYGLALMAAAPRLGGRVGRVPVASAVGWSFPLVLAPLALYSSNALLSSPSTGAAATPLVQALVVQPAAWALHLAGMSAHRIGSTLILATPRGSLSLGVGLVCAGLYPAVLFAGLVALHAWRDRVAPARAAALAAAGLAGLWLLNLVRLVLLAAVGVRWGMGALQTAHANLGWLLFCGFMALFWAVALRATPSRQRPEPAA